MRKYLPTLADLIDRMSICQIKEALIPEHKTEYAQEIKDILHDIDEILEQYDPKIDANFLRATIVTALYNLHIWHNESSFRRGIAEGNLALSHGLNGVRNRAKNRIQEYIVGGRKDHKTDCLAADQVQWEPSW